MKRPLLYWGSSEVPEKVEHAFGLDPVKLKLAALMALEDFTRGCTISKNFPIEVLLYYYSTTQISRALEMSREELRDVEVAYFADIAIPPGATWVTELRAEVCLYKLVDKEWISRNLQIRYYKRKRCRSK